MIIVVAWTEEGQELAEPGKTWRHDLGERPKMKAALIPKSVVWVNKGTSADKQRAEAYSKSGAIGGGTAKVFVYPESEKDPLARGRQDILKIKKAPRAMKESVLDYTPPKKKRVCKVCGYDRRAADDMLGSCGDCDQPVCWNCSDKTLTHLCPDCVKIRRAENDYP